MPNNVFLAESSTEQTMKTPSPTAASDVAKELETAIWLIEQTEESPLSRKETRQVLAAMRQAASLLAPAAAQGSAEPVGWVGQYGDGAEEGLFWIKRTDGTEFDTDPSDEELREFLAHLSDASIDGAIYATPRNTNPIPPPPSRWAALRKRSYNN
jgi:hypothetical protein